MRSETRPDRRSAESDQTVINWSVLGHVFFQFQSLVLSCLGSNWWTGRSDRGPIKLGFFFEFGVLFSCHSLDSSQARTLTASQSQPSRRPRQSPRLLTASWPSLTLNPLPSCQQKAISHHFSLSYFKILPADIKLEHPKTSKFCCSCLRLNSDNAVATTTTIIVKKQPGETHKAGD